ncbi:MAG: DUF488 domain-containing protein [Nitrospira sp.]|nr:DUF488 domain-containing protein [Nitrospira sp.]
MNQRRERHKPVVLTIGHSNRSLEAFLDLLRAHGVQRVVDVRTIPRSRHNPQFNRETLPLSLRLAKIGYLHMSGLGGLRRARPDSPNMGWRNASFRGYADYMQSDEFETALKRLMKAAAEKRVALMCAEAVPWRCHRSLIADALTVRGLVVEHITNLTRTRAHALTPFARVSGTRILYPADNLVSLDGEEQRGVHLDVSAAQPRRQAVQRRRRSEPGGGR